MHSERKIKRKYHEGNLEWEFKGEFKWKQVQWLLLPATTRGLPPQRGPFWSRGGGPPLKSNSSQHWWGSDRSMFASIVDSCFFQSKS